MNSKSLDYTRTVMRILFKYIFLRKFSEVEYFSSFRMMNAEVIQSSKMKNLFMVWKLKPGDIGNFPVNHFPTKKVLTSYTFIKRVLHFRPYLLLVAQKTGFAIGFISLLFSVLFFISNSPLLMPVAIFSLFLFVVGLSAFSLLKKTEKVIYQIESSHP